MVFTKCQSCGTEVPATMSFCSSCGSPVSHENAEVFASNKMKPGMSLKKLLIPAIAVVVVLVALVIVGISVLKPSKYEFRNGSVYISPGDETVVIIPHNKGKVELDGYLRSGIRSLDGTKAVQLISEDDVEWDTLLYITDKVQTIGDGIQSVWLAPSGNAFAYTREYDETDHTAELWLYSDGKSKKLADDFAFGNNNCTISPDGKTVAYVSCNDDTYTCIVWDGKTSTNLGKDVAPVAVADGSKYIYYTKNDFLYVQRGLNSDNKEKLGDNVYQIYANKDLSQLVYSYGSKSYISRNGGKKEPLSGQIGYFVLPGGTATFYDSRVTVLGLSAFAGTFYCNSDNAIVCINAKYETHRVAKNVGEAYLSTDGKTLMYSSRDSIYRVNGIKADAEAVEIVDGDVERFVAVDDGSAVFFITEDDEIFYQRGMSKPTLVTGDFTFDGYGTGYSLYKGNTLYYVSDEELFVSTGDRGVRVGGFDGEVFYVSAGPFAVAVSTDDDGETLNYRSTDGKKFELMHQS